MPKRSRKDHDFTTVARRVVEQAIGEKLDGSPLPDKDAGKKPAAVALAKRAALRVVRQGPWHSARANVVLLPETPLGLAGTNTNNG
jgi:hypothetical protein